MCVCIFSFSDNSVQLKSNLPEIDYEQRLEGFKVNKKNKEENDNKGNLQRVPTNAFKNEVNLPGPSTSKIDDPAKSNAEVKMSIRDVIKDLKNQKIAEKIVPQKTKQAKSKAIKKKVEKPALKRNAESKSGRTNKKIKKDKEESDKDDSDSEPEYPFNIETIIGKRIHNKRVEWLIKWEGYDNDHNSWEPISSFANPEKIKALYKSS